MKLANMVGSNKATMNLSQRNVSKIKENMSIHEKNNNT